jgi:FPC/CPF motif-containing protein YcgG
MKEGPDMFSEPSHDQDLDGQPWVPNTRGAPQRVAAYIAAPAFPCVGAKSALNKNRMRFGQFGALGAKANAAPLCERLGEFSDEFPEPGALPVSFVALFDPVFRLDEQRFENLLWQQLQSLHEHDRRSFTWNESVGKDAASNDFSFSIGGRAYFVVGLHPRASRLARRAPQPCLVFNFHDQFEALKASGK